MQRRHFLKLSAAGTAAMLLHQRMTYAAGIHSLVHMPDAVWAQTGEGWFRLTGSGDGRFAAKGVEVTLEARGDALGVSVQAPDSALNAIRLRWVHPIDPAATILGDRWERSYGDLAWKPLDPEVKNPWYVLLHDGSGTACFGVKTGCNAFCWWSVNTGGTELTLDTLSGGVGVSLGTRTLHAADIVSTRSTGAENAFATAHRFCKMMCAHPRLPKKPVYGINDWYFAYGNNSATLIRETTRMMAELVGPTDNRPFSVIDAGWAEYSPLLPGNGGWNETFSRPNDKFKDMPGLATDIKELGMRPGLWIRPLCARHDEQASRLLPSIPGRDDPKGPILDPTIPENIDRVRGYFDVYKQWGFDMVKHDYTTYDIMGRWGFQMKDGMTTPGWRFNDNSRTTAEVINHLYGSIREAAGDGIYVIGCNTVSHLSAGVFELCRIGDDTSGKEWQRTRKMGVNTLGFRIAQHNAFYAADGDCVGLTTGVPWERNKQWMRLLAESSAPLFISAQREALGAEQKAFVRDCFAKAARIQPLGEPLDWMTNALPATWRLDDHNVTFDWG